jgi:hypothetical protein
MRRSFLTSRVRIGCTTLTSSAFRRACPGREHNCSASRLGYETAVEGSGLIFGGTYSRPDQIVGDLGPIGLGHVPPDGPRSARPFLAVRCALACQLWPPPGQARRQANLKLSLNRRPTSNVQGSAGYLELTLCPRHSGQARRKACNTRAEQDWLEAAATKIQP